MAEETYKLLQIASVFIEKYGYTQVLIEQYKEFTSSEAWLSNAQAEHHELIRITLDPASRFVNDAERVKTYIDYFRNVFKREIRFVDIHISEEVYDPSYEIYPYANIGLSSYSGVDLSPFYPEIYRVLHDSDDPETEMLALMHRMQSALIARRNKLFIKKERPTVTYILTAICCIVFILEKILQQNYASAAVFAALGANYKIFTLGLRQYYRILTSAFVHGDFIHLISNVYSLLMLGSYTERRYGSAKMMIAVTACTAAGSLSQLILSDNSLSLGISGGLYGLMAIFVLDLVKNRHAPLDRFLPLIIVNLGINFMANIGWVAHLGGLICGYLLFMIYDTKQNRGLIILLAVLLISLSIKTLMIDRFEPIYGGTDMEIVKIYRDIGLNSYADHLTERLLRLYAGNGGMK